MLDTTYFAQELLNWYQKYEWRGDTFENGFPWIRSLERSLSQKARKCGYLDMEDLIAIAEWGGNQRGLIQRLRRNNQPAGIHCATRRAISNISDPEEALRELLSIKQWGLTYASKTLRFVCPEHYPALDRRLRKGLGCSLPPIWDGHINSMVEGYVSFLKTCRGIQAATKTENPLRTDKSWFIADIEMALFAYASTSQGRGEGQHDRLEVFSGY